jgi:hypothetical protein
MCSRFSSGSVTPRRLSSITADKGRIVFVSSSGELESDPSLTFDENGKTIKIDRLIADSFYGDGIDFRGREIRNAHLVDPSIEGLKHLTVESLALLRPRDSINKQGHHGFAIIDGNGMIETTQHMRWDENARELKLPSLSSFAKAGLEIRSDVDFTAHHLKNFNIEANTTLTSLIFKDGLIENTVLHNITATGLFLGDVALDSLSVSKFDSTSNVGSLVVVGEGGAIELSSNLKQEKDGAFLINSEVVITKSVNLNGQDITNANFRSGSIDGNIDVSVDHIKAKGIILTEIQKDKTVTSDALAVVGLDGSLKLGPITIDKYGSLGDIRVHGTIDFDQPKGKIKGATIVGGTADKLERLIVTGETELGSGLQVTGESYMDGSLMVSGSVLGSGPYVDISDKRFKRNIVTMESAEMLEKIRRLEGVSYELDTSRMKSQRRLGRAGYNNEDLNGRQYGFIAQDVEKIFPELIYTDHDDFKGLQYSRFAPIFAEGLKALSSRLALAESIVARLSSELDDAVRRLSDAEATLAEHNAVFARLADSVSNSD